MAQHSRQRTPGMVGLRNVVRTDVPIFFEHQLDPEASHMAAFTAADPSDLEAFTARWDRILGDETIIKRTILFEGRVVGNLACSVRDGTREVGYWIDREYWGRGIASRALKLFLEDVSIRPLYARTARDNAASIRVLIKCGFTISSTERSFAPARGEAIDEFVLKLEVGGTG